MRPSDIEYARDIFAELVTAIALKRPESLRTPEIEMLAEQPLNMAKRFAAAQQQSIQTRKVAIAQVESLDKPLPFGSNCQRYNSRARRKTFPASADGHQRPTPDPQALRKSFYRVAGFRPRLDVN